MLNVTSKSFMTNFSYQDKTWAEFSILELAICMVCNFGVTGKTAYLKVEKSAQTTSRFSPISYRAPRISFQSIVCKGK
jgi:hypothetical protein